LTAWTVEEARKMLDFHDAPVRLGDADDLAGLTLADLAGQGRVQAKLENLDGKIARSQGGIKLVTDYGGEPTIAPGESITLTFTAAGAIPDGATFAVQAPAGWIVRPGASHREADLLRRGFRIEQPAGEEARAGYHVAASLSLGGQQLAAESVPLVAKNSWRIAGPFPAPDLGPADLVDIAQEAASAHWRTVYTDGHALILDVDDNTDRVYLVEATLHNPAPRPGRIICATQERQVVYLDGEEIIRKADPTPFVPAPHRSGPGTAYAMDELPEALRMTIVLTARAGQPAELHLYLTEPADESLRRCCPIPGVFGTAE
jgi:hypothetical protein